MPAPADPAADSPSRPNVVVIVADDAGWGDFGCYGAEKIPTPRLDAIAAQGMRFTDCHSSSAVCSPSRYSLLTGRYAWRSPLKRMVLSGHSPAIIEPSRPTAASTLRQRGYATAAIGKWHLGLGWRWRDGSALDAFAPDADLRPGGVDDFTVDYRVPFSGGPLELGFDRFFGMAGSLDMPPFCYLDQDRPHELPNREKHWYLPQQKPGMTSPDWNDEEIDLRFAAESCAWIRERATTGEPFFLYHATSAPHRPCAPPEQFRGLSQAGARGDLVGLFDWVVGQIVDTLDAVGAAGNTLLIITSDNGAHPTDLAGNTYGHRANGPWRGQKADIWEAGHRVPLLVRWPSAVAAGTVNDELVCLTDILPTLAEVAGAEAEPGDGVSLAPTLLGQPGRDQGGPRLVAHHSGHGWFAARRDPWKAIFGVGSGGFSQPRGEHISAAHPRGQLYRMNVDPHEDRNLWDAEPGVVAELHEELRRVVGDASPEDFPADVDLRTA